MGAYSFVATPEVPPQEPKQETATVAETAASSHHHAGPTPEVEALNQQPHVAEPEATRTEEARPAETESKSIPPPVPEESKPRRTGWWQRR